MTPTADQFRRSNAKAWLLHHAPPSALRDIYESLLTAEENPLECRMIADVYFALTGQEITLP